MREATTINSERSEAKNAGQYARAHRVSILMVGIVLLVTGALLTSQEGMLAGAICTGTAMLSKRVFG